ncbi:DUF6520 family protein [Salegentibacter echinorum]|nr:DUF6520 family protein [Salegentibacter echinorum]
MKYLKMILPMMAMVFAIGLMFANTPTEMDPDNDYVLTNNGVVTIDEVDCGEGDIPCEGQFSGDNNQYPIYDDPALTIRKEGSGTDLDL